MSDIVERMLGLSADLAGKADMDRARLALAGAAEIRSLRARLALQREKLPAPATNESSGYVAMLLRSSTRCLACGDSRTVDGALSRDPWTCRCGRTRAGIDWRDLPEAP